MVLHYSHYGYVPQMANQNGHHDEHVHGIHSSAVTVQAGHTGCETSDIPSPLTGPPLFRLLREVAVTAVIKNPNVRHAFANQSVIIYTL